MGNLIAIDWDSHELRAVAGRTASGGITVTGSATMPITGDDVTTIGAAVNEIVAKLGVTKAKHKLIVAIGRGKAELRQLNLPPVPENELPAVVRFQAMQNFSTVGDSVSVDYLPVEVASHASSVIVGGVSPATMKQVEAVAKSVSLELKRVVLRPVAAAALFSLKAGGGAAVEGDCVLVDLLADDAEIVVFRAGKVVFVRSVRMPEQTSGRSTQIAGEIRRSLMACSGDSSGDGTQRVVIWGQAKTHQDDITQLRELLKCDVQTLDPLGLVDVDAKQSAATPASEHTGRLAPLIGVLAADAAAESTAGQSPLLVDFLNPRKVVEVQQDNRGKIIAGAAAAVAAGLVAYLGWSSLANLSAEIERREQELASLRPQVTKAEESIARTERVDQFLDSSVVWLDQFRRLAERMPPADKVLIRTIGASSLPREGGGRLTVSGVATSPTVVDEMQTALRDENHSVSGGGATEQSDDETYRWNFTQFVTIPADLIRTRRYAAFKEGIEAVANAASDDEAVTASDDESVAAADDEPVAAGDDEPVDADDEPAAASDDEPLESLEPTDSAPVVDPDTDLPADSTPNGAGVNQ